MSVYVSFCLAGAFLQGEGEWLTQPEGGGGGELTLTIPAILENSAPWLILPLFPDWV